MFKWAAKRFVDAVQQEILRRIRDGEFDAVADEVIRLLEGRLGVVKKSAVGRKQ